MISCLKATSPSKREHSKLILYVDEKQKSRAKGK